MTQTSETPPGMAGLAKSVPDENIRETAPNSAPNQVNLLRNPRAVREATIASIMDQCDFLLGGLLVHAAVAQQYAEIGDQRAFLYSLDQTVQHAICAGAEGVELRKIRKEMRGARQ
jgi:hypothetical protein